MKYAVFALLLLSACHKKQEGTPIPTVVIKGVSTDDITVVVSSECWNKKTAAYCESVSRALQRFYKADRVSESIAASERKWRAEEAEAR